MNRKFLRGGIMEIITNRRLRKTVKYVRAFLFIGSFILAVFLIFYIGIFLYAKILDPPPLAVPQASIYLADDGTVIGESDNGQKRYWVPIENISPELIQATLAVEDIRFYDHHGFDYKRIVGALLADMKAMGKVQGASTITQQYARNLFLSHEKTWKRKLLEAFYTIRLELNYSKEEILEGYLNTIYYGKGAYGVQAASQYYFGKDARDLSLAEAAILAGIPKGPNIYSPLVSYEKAKQRQKTVLQLMTKHHFISQKEMEEAANEKLTFIGQHSNEKTKIAPYFQDVVKTILKNHLGIDERMIALGGLKIYTTLNIKQQKIAEKQMEKYIANESDIQVAFISMEQKNGHVKAMIGGRNYEESSFNRAIQAIRQPGSTFKPLLYYAAIENGFTPATTMRSEQTTFRFQDNRPDYTPRNYKDAYANGEITMLQALALSDNIYAVKTHLFLGMDTLIETAKKFGITTKLEKVPSLALGTSGVRVLEMANAYSMLANGGKKISPVFIQKIEDAQGNIIYKHNYKPEQWLDEKSAFVTAHMMTGMFDRKLNGYASVTGSPMIDKKTREYAGKSGSTNTDNWMIGFSPQLVTAVWTGYDEGKTIDKTQEKTYAKNIWIHFMEEALQDEPKETFRPPKGTVGVLIDPENGKLATEDCPKARLTYFVSGTEPTEYCFTHIGEDFEKDKEERKQEKGEKGKFPWYRKIFQWAP